MVVIRINSLTETISLLQVTRVRLRTSNSPTHHRQEPTLRRRWVNVNDVDDACFPYVVLEGALSAYIVVTDYKRMLCSSILNLQSIFAI